MSSKGQTVDALVD